MMTAVFKYRVGISDTFNVDMPKNAEVLCCQVQDGQPYLWARVVTDKGYPTAVRRFRLAETGHPLEGSMQDGQVGKYLGTFQLQGGVAVFHLFDCGEM